MAPVRAHGGGSTPYGVVQLQDIGGGLNLKSSRYTLPPNQASKLQNWYLVEDGSILLRRGTRLWNAASLGAGTVLGGTRAYFAAANKFLLSFGGSIYAGDDATKTFTSTLAGLNATSLTWFWQYLSYVYVANKVDAPQKTSDGTTWTAMGIAAPSSAPTVAVGAAGVPSGTYTLEVTFGTPTTESNGSPASGQVTVTSQNISVTAIPLGPAGTTYRNIYGFKNTVSSVYQLIGKLNDNTTTTFTVTTDQTSWTTAIPTTNNPPVTGMWLTVLFKNRLWKSGSALNPTRVAFSQIFLPEAWPVAYFVDIPFDLGDVVTALFVLGDLLLIFSDNAIFYVAGDTPFSFVVKRSFSQVGTPGPWAVDRIENVVAFVSRFAVVTFDGAATKIISDLIEPQFTGIFAQLQQLNYAAGAQVALRYYDKLKALVISFPAGASTTNNKTYWHFLRRQGWVQDSRGAQLLVVNSGKGDDGSLYAVDQAAGILRQWDVPTVYDDDGVAITATYQTGNLYGRHPIFNNVWHWFTVSAKPANAVLNVTVESDQGQDVDSFAVSLVRGAVYGTGVYGTDVYASDFDDFEERILGVRGRAVQVLVVVTASVQVQLTQLALSYKPMAVSRRRVGVTG